MLLLHRESNYFHQKVSDNEEALKYISEKTEYDLSSKITVKRPKWYQYPLREKKLYRCCESYKRFRYRINFSYFIL